MTIGTLSSAFTQQLGFLTRARRFALDNPPARRRAFEHKFHRIEGFTDKYSVERLLYWESYDEVHKAIGREKQLKGWRREKKLWLIARFNPGWKNLAAGWFEDAPADNVDVPEAPSG